MWEGVLLALSEAAGYVSIGRSLFVIHPLTSKDLSGFRAAELAAGISDHSRYLDAVREHVNEELS